MGGTATLRGTGIRRAALIALLAGAAMALVLGLFALAVAWRDSRAATYPGPDGLIPLSVAAAAAQPAPLVASVLDGLYRAYEAEGEEAVYDTLAGVAAGEALEALYLEHRAALLNTGLETAAQAVHELHLLDLETTRAGGGIAVAARWAVLGSVGHGDHTHIRGNTYAADLALAPVGGQWRLTGFTLREVDQTGAGEVVVGHEDGALDGHD